jgi:hypothetical protein
MTRFLSLTPDQTAQILQQAQTGSQSIANSATPVVGGNTFVFFAAFDGTDNAAMAEGRYE